mgnify:CR=1 FL=1
MARPKKETLRKRVQEALDPIIEQAVREETENSERMPGRVVHGIKTAFTDADLVRIHGVVTFIPEETVPVSCNGVQYQLFADREMTVPKNIYNQYIEYRKRKRQPFRSLAGLNIQNLGAGPLTE